MKNLEIKRYNPSMLRNATLITNGNGFMRTYNLNNGLIYKEIKRDERSLASALYLDDFTENLTRKLQLSQELEDRFLVLPKSVHMNHDTLVGYTVPVIDMKSFDFYVQNSNDLDFITDSFSLLCNAVKEMNSEGVIFPDLANASNIFYDPKTKTIRFIDYDGLQVRDCSSFVISALMKNPDNPIFRQDKYFNRATSIFTTNFDKASLLALFLYYTTGTKLTKFKDFKSEDFIRDRSTLEFSLKKAPLEYYIKSIGLNGSPLEEDINLIYDNSKNNNYLETGIKRLRKTYKLNSPEYKFVKL